MEKDDSKKEKLNESEEADSMEVFVNCIIDIKKEGNAVLAYLPFNARIEFGIPKGSIYVKCEIRGTEFKSKLLARGNGRYCVFFSKQLLKNLGLSEGDHLSVPLEISPDVSKASELGELNMLENDTLKTIRERASIRSFLDREVSSEAINTILHAGLCAPSATNKRPFHFVVSQNREKMAQITANNHYSRMLNCAAACIIVCGDKIMQGIPEWLIEDCSAATQNMLLAIHSIGLGGVWCGVKQGSDFYKDIVAAFDLPGHIRPISLIAFGYPNDKKVQPNRYETSKIHFEHW